MNKLLLIGMLLFGVVNLNAVGFIPVVIPINHQEKTEAEKLEDKQHDERLKADFKKNPKKFALKSFVSALLIVLWFACLAGSFFASIAFFFEAFACGFELVDFLKGVGCLFLLACTIFIAYMISVIC